MHKFVFALLIGAVLLPTSASAQDDAEIERAIELFENGAILYEEGQYEQAVSAWEESYRISGEPVLLYNIANAYERLNRLEEALELYNEYRAYATSDERETLERRIRNIERRVEEDRAEQERLAAEQERLEQERAELEAAMEQQGEQLEQVEQQLETVRQPLPMTAQIIRYSGLTFAVAGFGLGAAFGSQANSLHSDLESACPGGMCLTSAESMMDDERSKALLADVSFVLGGLGTAAFISTFFMRPDPVVIDHTEEPADDGGEPSVSWLPIVGPNSVGLSIGGRF